MQRSTHSVLLLGSIMCALLLIAWVGSAFAAAAQGMYSISDYYSDLMGVIGGEWEQVGGLFTYLVGQQYFMWGFLLIISVIPLLFAGHLLIIGAKHFDHGGNQILFFPPLARIIHFIGALSFTLLVISGLLIVCGQFFGGGTFIRLARYVHIFGAILAVPAVLGMLVIWFKDMLPALCDIKWIFMLGGYLSKEIKPVPAKKYNAGQKMWYWCAVFGGLVMLATGFLIWGFGANLDIIRYSAIIHNVLGMVIVAFFLTHCYMSIFAIAGSLQSMKTGYKPEHEVHMLHSLHKYKESDVKPGDHH
ncbi:MAG: formate dehydrogenase subunit gamma [Desulfobulbaceae bacterium]|nr:MAG: formate dehydrogenase subunit gamma [Desulfobulbaceae bacterium]